eukprot:Lithocolla_globosa_v1_NODE_805_length_3253_cov_31.566604.p5 type:complete len:105 gc:universal NODE_805_length_3253_cov_31.566604:2111-2425(+)
MVLCKVSKIPWKNTNQTNQLKELLFQKRWFRLPNKSPVLPLHWSVPATEPKMMSSKPQVKLARMLTIYSQLPRLPWPTPLMMSRRTLRHLASVQPIQPLHSWIP